MRPAEARYLYVTLTASGFDRYGNLTYNLRMTKTDRFEMRLTDEGRLALARIAGYYGISQAAVVEMVVREADRRIVNQQQAFGRDLNDGAHEG